MEFSEENYRGLSVDDIFKNKIFTNWITDRELDSKEVAIGKDIEKIEFIFKHKNLRISFRANMLYGSLNHVLLTFLQCVRKTMNNLSNLLGFFEFLQVYSFYKETTCDGEQITTDEPPSGCEKLYLRMVNNEFDIATIEQFVSELSRQLRKHFDKVYAETYSPTYSEDQIDL
ncbi:hypothetical protein COEREDRAFT_88556 [Coemansia reversa NRRL 1564]|uniref:Uncharacterized protein n=1 Tax=Coemansia reversa (strain ATCC 12441 / NRRL 1564) TaxID=763665 RepID=A0A2G5B6G6_COERN|nr:hypothetical protein COEREDRAFT_88556 [Coemansia reversa NRRL 1564]|eukprot:PIA14582.1 hypothetical protein COEREDRAFT_88556 [Coemansia reversa NRRL 1564]